MKTLWIFFNHAHSRAFIVPALMFIALGSAPSSTRGQEPQSASDPSPPGPAETLQAVDVFTPNVTGVALAPVTLSLVTNPNTGIITGIEDVGGGDRVPGVQRIDDGRHYRRRGGLDPLCAAHPDPLGNGQTGRVAHL